jgi:hypothetical protein
VCSLERPEEAPDLTEPDKAAIEFADRMATDHLAIDEALFHRLRAHFNHAELMQLGFAVATFVGFGRLGASTWSTTCPRSTRHGTARPLRNEPASYVDEDGRLAGFALDIAPAQA